MAGQPAALLGLEKTSLRQQAVAALRVAITSGELAPSSPLVETELSEMLQVHLHRALSGQQTPQAALRDAAHEIRTLLTRSGLSADDAAGAGS